MALVCVLCRYQASAGVYTEYLIDIIGKAKLIAKIYRSALEIDVSTIPVTLLKLGLKPYPAVRAASSGQVMIPAGEQDLIIVSQRRAILLHIQHLHHHQSG